MADSAALLRMLEPAVRPVDGQGGGVARSGQGAAEPGGDSFEALLEQAREQAQAGDAAEPASAGQGAGQRVDPLSRLTEMQAVENASLRALMDQPGQVSRVQQDEDHG